MIEMGKLIVLFCLLVSILSATDGHHKGTLIVTYQTNKEGERLDRIRFWVKGDNFKQWLYPKGRSYVDDSATNTRKVVIENLQEGEYTIEFLVPNTDGFFEEVSPRHVAIVPGAVVR